MEHVTTVSNSNASCFRVELRWVLTIILFDEGGKDGNLEYRREILKWRADEKEWMEVGKMKVSRWYHAISTINMENENMVYCS